MEDDPAERVRSAITAWHEVISGLLDLHQEQLVLHRPAEATNMYEQFLHQLTAHIELEDRLLLPLHERLSGVRWPTELYRKEHRKIEKLAAAAREPLMRIPPAGRAYARWTVDLLDRQRTVKHVLDHHEQREEQGLLPELAGAESSALRAAADGCEAALADARALVTAVPEA